VDRAQGKGGRHRGELQRAAKGKSGHLLLIAYPQDGIPILRQSLVAYEGERPAYVTLVSTGAGSQGPM
jgi:hypothetical protein